MEISKNKIIGNVYGVASPCDITFIEGNRPVEDLKHVFNIKQAMLNGEFIPPIVIDRKTKFIVDGQHRFSAACDLWREGHSYLLPVIEHDFANPLLAAIQYNSKSKKWKTKNYVDAYIADGRQSYKYLQTFCQTHKLLKGGNSGYQYKAAAQLITKSANVKCFNSGLLQITEDLMLQAETTYRNLELIINAVGEERGGMHLIKRDIVLAWVNVQELILSKISIEKFADKMKKHFVCPISENKNLYSAEYLRVLGK